MLFPSPIQATGIPSNSGPNSSWIVWRSAMSWHGWSRSVSPLMTGTEACFAISSTSAWSKVRIMIPST